MKRRLFLRSEVFGALAASFTGVFPLARMAHDADAPKRPIDSIRSV